MRSPGRGVCGTSHSPSEMTNKPGGSVPGCRMISPGVDTSTRIFSSIAMIIALRPPAVFCSAMKRDERVSSDLCVCMSSFVLSVEERPEIVFCHSDESPSAAHHTS